MAIQPMSLKDFFKTIGSSFIPKNNTLPNGGGTYQSVIPNPGVNLNDAYNSGGLTPSTPFIGPIKPPNVTPPVVTPPAVNSPRVFKENVTPTPTNPVAPPALDYSKYTNPATGAPYSPKEYADMIASRAGGGAVPNYAGNSITQGGQTAEELARTARGLNNARNDIAVGETDPYRVASKSGIQYSPAELTAIEKAYAGIYDPVLEDVFAKMTLKKKEDDAKSLADQKRKDAELDNKFKLEQMAQQHKYNLAEDAANNKAKAAAGVSPNSGDFAATIDLVANMESSVYGKKAVADQLRSLIDSKDYASAYNQIANSIENQLVGEPKSKFVNARTDYSVMQGMKEAIQKYAAGGGDMNLLVGTEEEIKRKLGIDSGKASELAVYLWREFQTYRNNMTGAAFGAGESRDYASVNPSLKKSLNLNLSTIEGAQEQLKNRVISTINERVPSAKFIKDLAEGAVPGSGVGPGGVASTGSKILSKDGQSFDASSLTEQEYAQALADGYVAQ